MISKGLSSKEEVVHVYDKGSGSTIIINDKPKLAISLYHKYDDFYEIPNLILSFRPDYKLYIRHASEQLWETVLFAI